MVSKRWAKLKYHKVQHALWTCAERFAYACAGRQSGKTELALRRLVRYLPIQRPWPDPRYFFCSPTFGQAKRVAWQRLINLIPKNWIRDPDDIKSSELSIKTIFGSELFLFGLDKPQRIEGLICDGGVVDESSDVKPGAVDLSILPTLVWRNGWLWRIGVPKRFGVGATEYRDKFMAASRGELPDSAAFSWSSDGVVPQEYLELCRKTMDVRDFEEQFNASWLTVSGGVFHAFNREYNVRPCAYDPALPILVGMDFNVNPMAWVLAHLKGETLEVFDEIWLRDTNTPASLGVLTGRYGNHPGGFQIYGDASSKARKTSANASDYVHILSDPILKKLGRTLHIANSNPSKADRFAVTNSRICSGDNTRRLFIDAKCARLIHDLEVRSYKPGTSDVADKGDIGHPSDALGYILHKKFPLQLVIPNKQVITMTQGV